MIKGLFSNRNVEQILFFLFVNGECYGTQLTNLLQEPLTSIQNALKDLEERRILSSYYDGKTRIYHLNAKYPLRWELENLLKKAYTLLSPQVKKRYIFIYKKLNTEEEEKRKHLKKQLLLFWEQLLKAKNLSLIAKSRQEKQQMIKMGKADISLHLISPSVLIFEERGHWLADNSAPINFANRFCWTLDIKTCLITLEHLRRGAHHPVFLFHFIPTQSHKLNSVDPHFCGEDIYLGNIIWNQEKIILHLRIIGTDKNDELIYHYH